MTPHVSSTRTGSWTWDGRSNPGRDAGGNTGLRLGPSSGCQGAVRTSGPGYLPPLEGQSCESSQPVTGSLLFCSTLAGLAALPGTLAGWRGGGWMNAWVGVGLSLLGQELGWLVPRELGSKGGRGNGNSVGKALEQEGPWHSLETKRLEESSWRGQKRPGHWACWPVALRMSVFPERTRSLGEVLSKGRLAFQ